MNFPRIFSLLAVLVILLVVASGCTSPQTPGTPAPSPATTSAGVPLGTSGAQPSSVATPAAKAPGLDTVIPVRFNDYACIDIQKEMGVEYLYPDQKFVVWAAAPGGMPINVNVLLLDVTDYSKILSVTPKWNAVQRGWDYEGIVPIAQFNDITTPQQKTITIKNQGKFFLCADDRKEVGVRETIYRVPVKVTPA